MNAKFCACRTAALRIFIRSLVGPSSAQQQWRRFGGLASRQADSASISRYALRPVSRRPQLFSALHPGRTIHSSSTNYDVNAVPESSDLAAPPAVASSASKLAEHYPETEAPNADEAATTRIEEPAAETKLEVSGEKSAQTLGKHQRKKLRRQQEAEAARASAAAAAAASNTTSPSEPVPPSVSVIGASVEPTAGDMNATLKESPGNMDAATVITATAATTGEMKKTKKPRWTEAQRDERRRAKEANFEAASPPQSPPRSSPPPRSPPPRSPSRSPTQSSPPPRVEGWQIQKRALEAKFPEGWRPRKKLSPDALEGIRALHRQFPETYTTPVLAKHFMVSAEAVRRILKSRWEPQPDEEEDRQERWFNRGKQVWARYAALGRKPPKRWQAEGIRRDASWAGRRQRQLEWRQQQTPGEEQQEGEGGGEGEARAERWERRERREQRDDQDGQRGWKEQDEREGTAVSRSRSAGLEADRSGATVPDTFRRGRTLSQGKRTRLQREQQSDDESGTSTW